MHAAWGVWAIVAAAVAGVVLRPGGWPEAIWAVGGAVLLVVLGLLPAEAALRGVLRGADVYLFLTGMMLLSELARAEGLFDWLAAHAARRARGSAASLFTLVYGVGVLVTVFLSNDATAVVLTPAVAAVARAARVADALPYLFACALIANAASFVLPISNPANLVLYGAHMPRLLDWLPAYALPSAASVAVTYAVLRWSQRAALRQRMPGGVAVPALPLAGRIAAAGIVASGLALLAASWFDLPLGFPTFFCGLETTLIVLAFARSGAATILRGVSWGVLPLVAGLFVLVAALERTGATQALAARLAALARHGTAEAAWAAGGAVAVAGNLVNNLPAGLLAGRVLGLADVPEKLRRAVLIGVDLGPNLSVTGSLATILWLSALRRDGQHVGAWRFLRLGVLVMPPALLAALAAAIVVP